MKHEDRIVRVVISPGAARKLLATVDEEKYRWKRTNYDKLLLAMQSGLFEPLASANIAVDWNGKLWNGRHRLSAQVALNRTYTYNVRYCSPAMGQLIQERGDTPASWTTGDELKSRGESYRQDLGSALSYIFRFRSRGGFTSRTAPAPPLALSLLERNPAVRDWLVPVRAAAGNLRMSRGMCAAVAYLCVQGGAKESDVTEFWRLLGLMSSKDPREAAGAATESGTEALASFTEWVRRARPKRGQAVALSANTVWAHLHRTWNAWVTGYPVSYNAMRLWAGSTLPALSDGEGSALEPGSDRARAVTGGLP